MKVMAHFITACIFQKTIKTVKIDMDAVEFHTRLTSFYSQFRAVGVNYNQIVKILYRNFSEKKHLLTSLNWKNRRQKWRTCAGK
jgi:hypothetical protein